MVIDAAGERSEQGRFLIKSPDSSNAGLGARPHNTIAAESEPVGLEGLLRRHEAGLAP
jgi:hypothetical protein